MEMVAVKSSNISSIGYDDETQVLRVAFTEGSVYEYTSVPALVHRGLMSAVSKGSYLAAHVKDAGYAYRRIA